ncbi:hypothetical protein BRC62_05015 [Halobacteriales archaeon QH_10_67_13]|nr:MAG: hypothetical protein BRC62_05015 [Halobacteriales archaeon QH_10_67_13]
MALLVRLGNAIDRSGTVGLVVGYRAGELRAEREDELARDVRNLLFVTALSLVPLLVQFAGRDLPTAVDTGVPVAVPRVLSGWPGSGTAEPTETPTTGSERLVSVVSTGSRVTQRLFEPTLKNRTRTTPRDGPETADGASKTEIGLRDRRRLRSVGCLGPPRFEEAQPVAPDQ